MNAALYIRTPRGKANSKKFCKVFYSSSNKLGIFGLKILKVFNIELK